MSSDMLAQRLADMSLPADPVAVARLCALTIEALRHAEARLAQLHAALARTRRVGIAHGIVMASHRVTEEQAAKLLHDQGHALSRDMRHLLASLNATGIASDTD